MSSHEVNEKKYKLHVQPEDCVMDHKYSIFEDGEVVVMMNTLERHKDKPKELIEKLNAYPDLVAENERLRGVLEEAKKITDLYFAPWGAAKGAEWEFLSGDIPFTPENALRLIQRALSTEPARRG